MIMIVYNEVMAMNVDQCKLYAMWLWCYASYMLCVHDVMQVMQVICYMFMMLCKLCYVFMMLVMQITMINIDPLWHHGYASLVYDYMQDHIWYVMQVWCLIICKFIYDMLCKFGVWLYASNMCKFTP